MAYIATFQCVTGFVMDIYDSPRVPKTANPGYYVTISGIKEIEIWMAENRYKDKISKQDDIDFFIKQGWIRKYVN